MPPPRLVRSVFRALNLREAGRWIVYGFLVGIVSGLGACLLFVALEWTTDWTFEKLSGHPVVTPTGERLWETTEPPEFRR